MCYSVSVYFVLCVGVHACVCVIHGLLSLIVYIAGAKV